MAALGKQVCYLCRCNLLQIDKQEGIKYVLYIYLVYSKLFGYSFRKKENIRGIFTFFYIRRNVATFGAVA
jgi:hypothetical protein